MFVSSAAQAHALSVDFQRERLSVRKLRRTDVQSPDARHRGGEPEADVRTARVSSLPDVGHHPLRHGRALPAGDRGRAWRVDHSAPGEPTQTVNFPS